MEGPSPKRKKVSPKTKKVSPKVKTRSVKENRSPIGETKLAACKKRLSHAAIQKDLYMFQVKK